MRPSTLSDLLIKLLAEVEYRSELSLSGLERPLLSDAPYWPALRWPCAVACHKSLLADGQKRRLTTVVNYRPHGFHFENASRHRRLFKADTGARALAMLRALIALAEAPTRRFPGGFMMSRS